MQWFSTVLGATLILMVGVDLFMTVFQPSLRGPVSKRLNRLAWSMVRRLARTGASRAMTFGGPLAIVADVGLWLGGLVVGFALVYLPALDDLSSAPTVPLGHHGVVAALYMSGVTAFTIGFGDVVPGTNALRIVSMLEGAAGAGLLSAGIAYVLSVYPIVTEQRATALRFSDLRLQDSGGLRSLVAARGLEPVASVHDSLIRNHQHLGRFPILYYFHPRHEDESTYALLRGAAMTCAVLRWGLREEDVRGARHYADAIDATLERTIDDYITGYVRGLSGRGRPLELAVARRRLRALSGDEDEPAESDVVAFARWAGRIEHFLAGLANAHHYDSRPLFPEVERERSRVAAA